MRVCAVLQRDGAAPEGADAVVAGPALAAAVPEALLTGCDWLWLLDAHTTPAPGALPALSAVLDDLGPLPAPLVLAGKVVGPDGEPHPASLPLPEMFEKDVAVAAAERGLLQVRATRPGSVLVRASVVERFGPPRADLSPPLDVLEWTARILRRWEDTGFLVPASVARRTDPPRQAPPPLRARVRAMLRGRAWTPTEKLWNAYLLSLRAEPGRAPRA